MPQNWNCFYIKLNPQLSLVFSKDAKHLQQYLKPNKHVLVSYTILVSSDLLLVFKPFGFSQSIKFLISVCKIVFQFTVSEHTEMSSTFDGTALPQFSSRSVMTLFWNRMAPRRIKLKILHSKFFPQFLSDCWKALESLCVPRMAFVTALLSYVACLSFNVLYH